VHVAVVEQATFPQDTLSTHFIHAQALAFLDRLGVVEEIRATGAPLIGLFQTRQEDLEYVTPIPQRPDDVGGVASVRRTLLDPILARATADAGPMSAWRAR
jgi:2-polyprenyl-6-methoxyphenol hydroxylase-like FAD-dependent oxidoreductase